MRRRRMVDDGVSGLSQSSRGTGGFPCAFGSVLRTHCGDAKGPVSHLWLHFGWFGVNLVASLCPSQPIPLQECLSLS